MTSTEPDTPEALIEAIRGYCVGQTWDGLTVDDVRLLTAPGEWPMQVRLDYTMSRRGKQRGRRVVECDGDRLSFGSLEANASMFHLLGFAIDLMDRLEPPDDERVEEEVMPDE